MSRSLSHGLVEVLNQGGWGVDTLLEGDWMMHRTIQLVVTYEKQPFTPSLTP